MFNTSNYCIIIDLSLHFFFLYQYKNSIQIYSDYKYIMHFKNYFFGTYNPTVLTVAHSYRVKPVLILTSGISTYLITIYSLINHLNLNGKLYMTPNQAYKLTSGLTLTSYDITDCLMTFKRQFKVNKSRFVSYNETLLSLMCLLLDSTYFFEQECSISCILEKNIKFNTALYQVFVSKHISTIRINSPSLCRAHIMWTN